MAGIKKAGNAYSKMVMTLVNHKLQKWQKIV
jgi:hypothetical protein